MHPALTHEGDGPVSIIISAIFIGGEGASSGTVCAADDDDCDNDSDPGPADAAAEGGLGATSFCNVLATTFAAPLLSALAASFNRTDAEVADDMRFGNDEERTVSEAEAYAAVVVSAAPSSGNNTGGNPALLSSTAVDTNAGSGAAALFSRGIAGLGAGGLSIVVFWASSSKAGGSGGDSGGTGGSELSNAVRDMG